MKRVISDWAGGVVIYGVSIIVVGFSIAVDQ